VYKTLLPTFYVGDIVDYKLSEFVVEHRALRQKLLKEGLFATHPSFYVKLTAWLASLLGAALYFTLGCASTSAHMTGAAFLALFWQQLAFLGHDIGHNAVSHVRRKDMFWGILFGNTLGGISLGWWKKSHNVHHVICNSIEHDPDIQHLPFLAVDEGILGKFFSTFHEKWFVHDAAARFFVSYQHYLYYVVMSVARFNLYVQGILHIIFDKANEYRKLEAAAICAFFVWVGALVWYALPTWQERLGYVLISHALAGVLHVQITLSHFAEDVYHGKA
jgi:delta8-fatty-acid desaturase